MMLNRKWLSSVYFLLCALEGSWVFYSFWEDTFTGNGTPGLVSSPLRLVLLGGVALLVVLCAALLAREILPGKQRSPFVDWLQKHRMAVLLNGILFIVLLVFCWVVIFSPFGLSRVIAYYQRWQPLFVWGFLMMVQLYGLAALTQPANSWVQTARDLLNHPFWIRIRKWLNSPALGFSLLGIAFLLGLTKLVFGQFADEANNLVYGWLVSKGYAFTGTSSPSISLLRITGRRPLLLCSAIPRLPCGYSLLILQAGLFGFSMWATRLYFPIGIATLAWGLTSQFHRGNMILYDNFDGTFLTTAFILVFFALIARTRIRKVYLVVTGLCLGCALLSNPLLIYPALVILLGLFLSGLHAADDSGWRESLRRLMWAGAAAGLILGCLPGVFAGIRHIPGFLPRRGLVQCSNL